VYVIYVPTTVVLNLNGLQDQDGYSTELHEHLRQLLELVDRVRAQAAGRDFFNQVCTSAALDAALDEMDREYEQQRRRTYSFDDASSSDMESFVSALDVSTYYCVLLLSAKAQCYLGHETFLRYICLLA
jgi:hypothetical protein